ncbi:helix-turn-helix domain-containing protein [Pseudonocardia endophytica]|uniref:GAF domain-containing protein n=1 Tax=Pseudonocardia endophytica TaxID=401976 RepID=A0A4R1HXU8_PSEEN|nr:helix-turn-helix domain-containing protein [Pseudonocardia endophytica]TCK22382.1 GAF domain-containing protein [Pseudonocardia endophytica]
MIGTDLGWMAAAADVLRALNADEPRDAVLGRVARHTCELARVERCSVMLLDPSGERLVVRAGHALTEHYLQDLDAAHPLLVHPADHTSDLPAAQAVRERRTVLLPDVTATDTLQPWQELVRAEGIRSVLAVPLGDSDGPVAGVLVGYTTTVREFGSDELALAELMAQYAATVLKTADLRDAEQRTIADLLRERERREWAEQQDRNVMRLLLDDAGLDGVLDALAHALGASVVLEALDGTVLGRAGDPAPGVPPAPPTRTSRTLLRALSTVDDDRRAVRLRPSRGRRAWVVPVAVADELAARLWVSRPDPGSGSGGDTGADTEWPDRPVIERFSLLVALELLKRRRAVETELRLTRDLAVELVSGTGDERSLLDRARALGHDLTRPHTVVLIPAAASPGTAALSGGLAARSGARPLAGEHDGALVVLVPGDPSGRDTLAAALAALVGDRGPIVLGRTVTEVADYPVAWRTVRTAHRLARDGGVIDLDRLGVAGMLLETGTPDGLRRLADRRLGALEEHDRTRAGELVHTLRAWLRTGCSTTDTARALHLHPHTVSYRLRRVAALTGTDPRETEGVFELQVALMVRDVQLAREPRPGNS